MLRDLVVGIVRLFQEEPKGEEEAMPMPELIRCVCTVHKTKDPETGKWNSDHTADMTWEQLQDYEGECAWMFLAVVNPAS